MGTMTPEVEAEHLDVIASFYPSCENATNVTDILQFNFSEFDYPGGGGPWPPPLGLISAMKITFCIINMIVSILGNCAVIIAVYHNPALRSTINFYLVNLIFVLLALVLEAIIHFLVLTYVSFARNNFLPRLICSPLAILQ